LPTYQDTLRDASKRAKLLAWLPLFPIIAALAFEPAAAQPVPPAGKTVQMIIGFGPGGGYDLWGRTVARHFGKHLPGAPSVVAQNMPGAGSYVAANHIYNTASKDGTVLGIVARDVALGPLTGAAGARFDATRFSWIGSPAKETNVCIAYHSAAVKNVQDLFQKELILGDTGPGTGTRSYPKALNELLGMKFKLVGGFQSSADVFLAMERGEVEGFCESLDSIKNRRPDWIDNKTVAVLFYGGSEPNSALKDIPFILDLARDDEQKRTLEFLYTGQGIGRPFVAPPDLSPERLRMLRDAFDATLKDPAFIAEARIRNLELDPVDGERLANIVGKIYATPSALVEKVAKWIR
jgi:tripartite-type tricarboxylate transporter receptor subunit TctC